MSVLTQLASALNRRDEEPNIALAEKIVTARNAAAVKELAAALSHKKKEIQSDCIKVLYETGYRDASLIAPYRDTFLALLSSKNNRLQWGAMTALDCITPLDPKGMYDQLPQILKAAQSGSVITRDHAVGILTKLLGIAAYSDKVFPLLREQLLICPTNQLPKYAEDAMPFVGKKHKAAFVEVLTARVKDMDSATKLKRLMKVIGK